MNHLAYGVDICDKGKQKLIIFNIPPTPLTTNQSLTYNLWAGLVHSSNSMNRAMLFAPQVNAILSSCVISYLFENKNQERSSFEGQ
jgi:hypothetical protein